MTAEARGNADSHEAERQIFLTAIRLATEHMAPSWSKGGIVWVDRFPEERGTKEE
ncbi:MAG: hypothetical protein PHW10_04325 [Candidatus Peribacteraceae bacterium]|nr:hypothetical protein [Candidatus Peribacteraceae bacterium]